MELPGHCLIETNGDGRKRMGGGRAACTIPFLVHFNQKQVCCVLLAVGRLEGTRVYLSKSWATF